MHRLRHLCIAALLVGAAAAQSPRSIRWGTLPDLPDPVGVAGAFVGTHGDALIVAGGANFPAGMPWDGGAKVYHDRIHVWHGGRWRTVAARLPARTAYGVSISTAAGLVCIGGQHDGAVHAAVYRLTFDPASDTVQRTALPDLPRPLSFAGGARVQREDPARDAIYVVGGQHAPAGSPGNSCFRLDLRGGTAWETQPPLPGPPRGLPAVAAFDGALYVFSGRDYGPRRTPADGPFAFHQDLLRYDPGTASWDPPRPITVDGTARCVMAATALAVGDRILVFGGASGALLQRSLELPAAERADFLAHHPGFSRDVLAYHPATDTFTRFGRLHAPHKLPVTTTAVLLGDTIVLPSGEVSPGKRSRRVWTASLVDAAPHAHSFGFWNWLALILYLLGVVAIGVVCSRRVHGTDEFFLAGRRIPWWAAGLSIFGTQLSAITFMALPATTYAGDWVRIFGTITLMVCLPFVAWYYVPVFRGLTLSTAYEYLERRFGPAVRTLAASLFILLQFGRMGIVLFLPSIALSAVTGVDVFVCIALMGVLAILYTVLGGIEAVIWTDVAQVIVLMGGALLALVIAVTAVGGIDEVIRIGLAEDKFRVVHHGFGLDSMTVPVMAGGLLILNLIPYTSDQTVIQRYITTPDLRSASRSLWTNFWMTAPTGVIFFGLGTALYAFYTAHPELPTPVQNDRIVPWFIVHELPDGIAGLAIAAVFAASMSSLDSSMNSVSTVMIYDFYRRWHPDTDDATQLRLGRILTLVLGLIGTGTALVMASVDIKFLFDAFNKLLGLFGGALAGLFFLGVFCKSARAGHALVGTLAGALTVGVLELLNLTMPSPPVHPYLFAACGFLVCAGIGWSLSRIGGAQPIPPTT